MPLQELDLLVFWGSQGGRAERLAGGFARECSARYGIRSLAVDLDDYDYEDLPRIPSSKLVVFVISTFGEGDPTDNSYGFYSALSALFAEGKAECLRDLQYAAFGLGNRNYKYFNRVIDTVDDMLQQLGAKRLGTVGRADEARGGMATEEDFTEWKEAALGSIKLKFGVEERAVRYTPELDIVPVSAHRSSLHLGEPKALHPVSGRTETKRFRNGPLAVPVVISRDLTPSANRRYIHLEFDLSGDRSMKYQTGDHLAVWPQNPEEEIQRLCHLLGLSEEERTEAIELKSRVENKEAPIPSPTTRETILRHYLQICAPVSRDLLWLILEYCPNEEATEIISTWAKDKDKFNRDISSRYLTLSKVLQLAGGNQIWQKLPFTLLVEGLGKLQPRYYSIASSPSLSPHQPAITVSVTSKLLGSFEKDVRFYGVASNYLLAIKPGHVDKSNEALPMTCNDSQHEGPHYENTSGKVFIQLRRSTFKLPPNSQRPIIMIGAGTGVAPFRAFVQERAALASHSIPTGPMLLLFGCRSPSDGYLYAEEWKDYETRVPNFEVVPAFSQFGSKIHVQDLVVDLKDRIVSLLDQSAAVYICGSADMARNVRNTLMKILMDSKGWSEVEAERYIMHELKRAKRFQEDVWSD
jgi:NADPH-ferrihemoprotein reductase